MKLFLALVALASTTAASSQAPTYGIVARYTIGGDGGWDYLTVDSADHRLYVSRSTRVIVVDTVTGKQIGEIPGTAGVHGIAIDRALGRGFTSNGRDNSVTVFDLKSLKTLGKISVGQNPDAILYEPSVRRIITCNGRSNDLSVIDPVTEKVVATVKLAGKPETPASDGKTLFVNIEDKSSIERIDLSSMTSRGTWSIAPVEEPSGLAFDKKNHTLYAVGSNKLMAAVDSSTGKVIATPAIGDGPDAAGFDERRHLIFSSNGEGTITILRREKGDTYRTLQTVTTVPSARTMTLDPDTGLIYLSSAQLVPGQGRRAMAPGSFTILVVGPVRS